MKNATSNLAKYGQFELIYCHNCNIPSSFLLFALATAERTSCRRSRWGGSSSASAPARSLRGVCTWSNRKEEGKEERLAVSLPQSLLSTSTPYLFIEPRQLFEGGRRHAHAHWAILGRTWSVNRYFPMTITEKRYPRISVSGTALTTTNTY